MRLMKLEEEAKQRKHEDKSKVNVEGSSLAAVEIFICKN